MKKIILVLVVVLTLFSCSKSPENIMKSEIKTYLDKNAKDPSSYEFIDLTYKKVTKGDLTNLEVGLMKDDIESINKDVEFQNKMIRNYPTLSHEKETATITEDNNKIDSLNKSIKEKINLLKNKTILGYMATHHCRLKNGFGALDLATYYGYFDKDYKLLELSTDLSYEAFKNQ